MDRIERKMCEFQEELTKLRTDLETKREIRELREEVVALRTEIEKVSNMVAWLTVTVAQSPPRQRPQHEYLGYQHGATTIGDVWNSGHQPQRAQRPRQQQYQQQPRQQAPQQRTQQNREPRTSWDPIPSAYA